jgi:hypothetical protein
MKIGIALFGAASAAAGVLDLIWGEFEPDHQPLQAWGDHIPGVTVFAYIAALWLIVGGAALLWRKSRQFGAAALTILYGIFVLFPLPRFITAPHYLGHRLSVYIGVVSNACEQVVIFVAAATLWGWLAARSGSQSPKAALAARCAFGFCPLAFGVGNLIAIDTVTPLVPKWLPPSTTFWAVLTGVAFAMAGMAILSGVLDILAARLLGLMLLVFSALALLPLIFVSPHDHTAWGGNAYNLTVVGAAWIIAEWLADRRQTFPVPHSSSLAKPSPA